MSDDMANDSGRVTTAMVFRAVDDQGKWIRSEFDSVHLRLDALSQLPERVTKLESAVTDMQAAADKSTVLRTALVTTIPVGVLSLVIAALQLFLP